MKALYGLYTDPEDVQRAVDGLRRAGVADPEIVVLSAEPVEEYEFGHRDRATWMFWIATGGGAVGLAIGTWLTRMTELAWPLPTGGMPIVAWWPNLIVMFELTMLGAIIATVATLLVTAGLPARRATLYDPEISDGKILVGVQNPRDSLASAIESALSSGSSAQLKRV
jgi:hypothetical protein